MNRQELNAKIAKMESTGKRVASITATQADWRSIRGLGEQVNGVIYYTYEGRQLPVYRDATLRATLMELG